jgi:hypothetical protein
MPQTLSKVAKDYRRAAINRYDDAESLYRAGRSTGAIYMAGYAVECMLKVLVLSMIPLAGQAEFAKQTFLGSGGHDFEFLRTTYLERGGARFPAEIAKGFTLVSGWSTELRYDPSEIRDGEAQRFLVAVKGIMAWTKGRV